MCEVLDDLDISEIVSGGARGADSLARRYAQLRGIKLTEFLPDWKTLGRSAGILRNIKIIDSAERVVAFWNGTSRGTKHAISYAKAQKKPVKIVWPKDKFAEDFYEELGCA